MIFALTVSTLLGSYQAELHGHFTWTWLLIKGVTMIYYLRLGRDGTPLINALTYIVLFMLLGEYLAGSGYKIGPVVVYLASITFCVAFLLRQKLKKRDKLSGLKTGAVFFWGVTNIICWTIYAPPFLMLAWMVLGCVYLYTRLMEIINETTVITGAGK